MAPRSQESTWGGECVRYADDTGWGPDNNPFNGCAFQNPYAEYDYTVTMPDGRVSVNHIRYTGRKFAIGANVDCRWGVAECELRGDYVYLFSTNVLFDRYCTAEGYQCVADNRGPVRIVYASALDENKRVERVFPARTNGTDTLALQCKTSTFGGTDPDPGVGKYCYRA